MLFFCSYTIFSVVFQFLFCCSYVNSYSCFSYTIFSVVFQFLFPLVVIVVVYTKIYFFLKVSFFSRPLRCRLTVYFNRIFSSCFFYFLSKTFHCFVVWIFSSMFWNTLAIFHALSEALLQICFYHLIANDKFLCSAIDAFSKVLLHKNISYATKNHWQYIYFISIC